MTNTYEFFFFFLPSYATPDSLTVGAGESISLSELEPIAVQAEHTIFYRQSNLHLIQGQFVQPVDFSHIRFYPSDLPIRLDRRIMEDIGGLSSRILAKKLMTHEAFEGMKDNEIYSPSFGLPGSQCLAWLDFGEHLVEAQISVGYDIDYELTFDYPYDSAFVQFSTISASVARCIEVYEMLADNGLSLTPSPEPMLKPNSEFIDLVANHYFKLVQLERAVFS